MDRFELEHLDDLVMRVKYYNVDGLVRSESLGVAFSFEAAVSVARKIVDIFRHIPDQAVYDLPKSFLDIIDRTAKAAHNSFSEISSFDPSKEVNPAEKRALIINGLDDVYNDIYLELIPIISFFSSNKIRNIVDSADRYVSDLSKSKLEAEKILDEIRSVAAEKGVSQQAIYFKIEYEGHDNSSKRWLAATIFSSICLIAISIFIIVYRKNDILMPANLYETIQISLGKLIIFGIFTYIIILCARNFISHKHNYTINRHRYNALLTFNALVDAAKDEDKRDIVLTYASACIFSPQDTGYVRHSAGVDGMPAKIIEILPKIGSSGSP